MILVAVLVLFIVFFLFLKKWPNEKYLQGLPEPPADPILGHITLLKSTTDIIRVSFRALEYGKTIKMRFGPSICPLARGILTIDYKWLEFILSSNTIIKKSFNYAYFKNWLGNGLIISDGEHWRRNRKILTPAFHFGILREFVEVFEKVGDVFIEKLGRYDGTEGVNLKPLTALCTLDVICGAYFKYLLSETAMGTKLNVQSGENPQYVQSVTEMCRIAISRAFSAVKALNPTYIFTRDYFRERKILKILHGFTKDILDSKMKNKAEHKTKRMAFLDQLLKFSQNEDGLSQDEIREEVDTFMFAGHDTTASAICFTLYCLADHPEIQEKILQEQRDLFGDDKNPAIAYADLANMKYLENVIKESFRLYPPVPTIGRAVMEDVEFENCLIPKYTNIVLFTFGVHRNPEYFPEPEKFIPERFETSDGSMPYAYIPFSAGPRNCIGQKFAMLELKSIISKIVRHFEIKPTTPRHEMELAVEAVLTSVNGVKVVLKKRP